MALLYTVAASTLAGLAAFWIDFKSWRDFGTGGTPPTLSGYLKIRRWGLYLLFKRHNVADQNAIPNEGASYLEGNNLPKRAGPRPKSTRWTLPQRQLPTSITPTASRTLATLMQDLAASPTYSAYINTAPSKTEGGTGPAIYVNSDVKTVNPNAKNIFYEVAHVHPKENSLHVYLSPRDARIVLEKGWAQRFPIFWITPAGWVHVFAPTDDAEVEVVREIVRSAICFAVGGGGGDFGRAVRQQG
ncbi:hypothetical protein N7501_011555 [Penicillium viridicatum]|nr:hypothetical protein N7501_011555 [Penicillium viridicatum]